jgi:hypothetical protein
MYGAAAKWDVSQIFKRTTRHDSWQNQQRRSMWLLAKQSFPYQLTARVLISGFGGLLGSVRRASEAKGQIPPVRAGTSLLGGPAEAGRIRSARSFRDQRRSRARRDRPRQSARSRCCQLEPFARFRISRQVCRDPSFWRGRSRLRIASSSGASACIASRRS